VWKENEEKGNMEGKFSSKGKINVKWARNIKGIVSRDFLIRFMISIIKLVLFVRPLIPLRFFL
jgi:uncharacterized membrane protein